MNYLSFCRFAPQLAAIAVLSATPTQADIFRYRDGRVIAGKVVSETRQTSETGASDTAWAVEIEPGVLVQIFESELELNGREPLSDARKQYAERVAGMEQSVESHLQMAGECSKYGLTDLARAHFQRVLDLDPDNKPARVAAGYDKDQNGRWVKQEVVMSGHRGKVQYKGRWRFPESVVIEQEREVAKQTIADATKDLVRWHRAAMSASGKRYDDAILGLQQINDPLAIGTVAEYLLDTRKPPPLNLKLLYVHLLAQFQNFEAARALATAAILDPYPQVRNACLDALSRFGREAAIPIFASYLQSDNNALINIAAEGLGQLRGETAVLPLIEAVVSTHTQEVGSDGMNASPTSGSFSMGSKKTQKILVNNQAVLGTLAQLTGQNFGFDKDRWMMWYASAYAFPANDLRRDP